MVYDTGMLVCVSFCFVSQAIEMIEMAFEEAKLATKPETVV